MQRWYKESVDDQSEVGYSPAYELVRTGFKVVLGPRGEAVAELLDRRRDQRARRRTALLAREAEAAGLDATALLQRVQSDDEALELLEEVVSAAQAARMDDKIRYLGRCLANALATNDDAAVDATWLRIAAIRDIEAPHVRLMATIAEDHRKRWNDGVPEHELIKPARGASPPQGHLQRRAPTLTRFDRAEFEPLVATLVRHGVVTTNVTYDVEILSEVQGKAIDDLEVDNQSTVDATVRYVLTALGREILSDIRRTPGET